MKKFLLSFGVILTSVVYAISQNVSGPQYTFTPSGTSSAPSSQTTAPAPARRSTPAASSGGFGLQQSAQSPITAPAPQTKQSLGQYKNGTYVGAAADAYYGTVQVQARVQSGKIADIQFLQYPSDRSTSRFINSQAMPILISEALQVQSAAVDIVSGATHTSSGFQQSLADALVQAK